MKTFKTGTTYFTRSACDHNCIYDLHVVRRTAKTIWAASLDSPEKAPRKYRIKIDYKGNESVSSGNHSMAHGWSADDTEQLRPDWA